MNTVETTTTNGKAPVAANETNSRTPNPSVELLNGIGEAVQRVKELGYNELSFDGLARKAVRIGLAQMARGAAAKIAKKGWEKQRTQMSLGVSEDNIKAMVVLMNKQVEALEALAKALGRE